MKKYSYLSALVIGSMAIASTTLTGCADDYATQNGEGTLSVKASISSKVQSVSRDASMDELAEQCEIWISGSRGAVRHYTGISNLPTSIPLTSGSYVAEAWTGDSVSASWDKQWYKGRVPFEIVSGQQTQIDLVCKIANVVASVSYDEDIPYLLSDYSMTIGHSRGQLVFEGSDTRKGFFMMPQADKDLTWTFSGTRPDGTIFTRTGTITNAKPAYEYVIKVKCTGEDVAIGGGYFTIEVDENAIEEIENQVVISLPPSIQAYYFDLNETQFGQPGQFTRKSLYITAVSALQSVMVDFPGLGEKIGISGDDFDLLSMGDAVKAAVEGAGINYEYSYNTQENTSAMKINFSATLLNSLGIGEYPIEITATDANGKTSSATMKIVVTEASVSASPLDDSQVSTYSATLSGTVLKDDVDTSTLGFYYRKKGSMASTYVAADHVSNLSRAVGTVFTATVRGLEPGTVYEYWAVTPTYTSADIKEFTTGTATQLPNASFEYWQGSKPMLVYGAGQQMFWDSGNHGSKSAGKDITTASTEKVHSGTYSAKLASESLFSVMAAGNIFTGEFLGTEGTNGVLGFGRQWDGSRPVALRGWVHYTPATVTNAKTNPDGMAKGDLDKGIIYFALLDGTTDSYNGKNYPFIIKTKSAQLYNKEAQNVIAHGEKIFDSATPGNDLVQFEIPLTYFHTNVKPQYILVVCSACKNGDYFTGGPSVMYVDDFELVYE